MMQAVALALAAVLLVTYYLGSPRFRHSGAAGREALGQRRPA
jgi:hypothetical protein